MRIDKQKLSENKEFFISLTVALVCLVLFFLFPAGNLAQKITKTVFFMFLLPVLYIKLILRKNLRAFGLNFKNPKFGILGSILLIILSVGIFWAILRFAPESSPREMPRFIVENFGWFLLYELLIVNLYLFSFEFFFRGFLITVFPLNWRMWSVYLQAAVFGIFAALSGATPTQIVSDVILAAGAGIVMQKTGSIFYAYSAAIFSTFILDAYLISTF